MLRSFTLFLASCAILLTTLFILLYSSKSFSLLVLLHIKKHSFLLPTTLLISSLHHSLPFLLLPSLILLVSDISSPTSKIVSLNLLHSSFILPPGYIPSYPLPSLFQLIFTLSFTRYKSTYIYFIPLFLDQPTE